MDNKEIGDVHPGFSQIPGEVGLRSKDSREGAIIEEFRYVCYIFELSASLRGKESNAFASL